MKNVFLNIMAFIIAACMVTITFFVVTTAGTLKENSNKSLAKISDIEEQIEELSAQPEEETPVEIVEPEETTAAPEVDPEQIEDLSEATAALADAVSRLQEGANGMSSVDYETLNNAITTLNETAQSLEATADRLSAFFG